MGLGSAEVEESQRLLDLAISAVRCLEGGLRPPDLEFGLDAALEYQGQIFQKATGIRYVAKVRKEDLPVDAAAGQMLLRIIRQVLTAVEIHAAATEVSVSSATGGMNHLFEIRDNGTGSGASPSMAVESLRTLNLEHLAADIGGSITISGIPGMGAAVQLRIPSAQGSQQP